MIITIIACVFALQYAEAVLAPVVFALVLGIVVTPLGEKFVKAGVPRVIGASLLLFLTSFAVILLFVLLEPLLSLLVERLPRLKFAVESWIETLSGFLRGLESISDEIEATVGAEKSDTPTTVPSIGDALWLAPNLGAQVFIFVGTFFFFILTREEIYAAAGQLEAKLYRADALVSRYFAAVTVVNIGVGVATAGVMLAIGVDYAVLWGLAAGVLNYILYLGPLIIIGGLLVAGLVQFWGWMAFVPPVAFLCINFIEAQFVTPLFVGQHLKVNPLVVFLAIAFGLWLWGPIGAIVALPVILWLGLLLQTTEEEEAEQPAHGDQATQAGG